MMQRIHTNVSQCFARFSGALCGTREVVGKVHQPQMSRRRRDMYACMHNACCKYVCMVCMYVSMFLCISVYGCMYLCAYVFMYISMLDVYMYLCVYVSM